MPAMSESAEKIEIYRGLKGVYFDRSRACYIDGRERSKYTPFRPR